MKTKIRIKLILMALLVYVVDTSSLFGLVGTLLSLGLIACLISIVDNEPDIVWDK